MTSGHFEESPDRAGPEERASAPDSGPGPVPEAPDTDAPEADPTVSADDEFDEAVSSAEMTDDITKLVTDLSSAKQAVGDLTVDLQRLQAEYLNYKRRVERDRDLVRENALFSVLSGLLPVLDDLDRAREHGELEGGFKAVADSLERIVAAQGLVKFGAPGDEFDPRLHEALMHAHSPDVTTTTCQNIVSAGYKIGDRVVRPAQVTVVDPEPAPADDGPTGEG